MSAIKSALLIQISELVRDTLPRAESGEVPEILFGPGGSLDSLALVNFVADLEFRIAQEFGCDVTLASEMAMSRTRSPFRDVASLSEYIAELLSK